MIPDAGHMVQMERPEAVNRHLLRFLESLKAEL
ncbi:Putative non-heme bromoperoxidase BpoC [Pandoraea terrae]|uniref:Non-heme bromoperoxidase BpoC n=1 Tax=Pandoraea terrae TaxID=1537710 RepID=A0A5E4Z909_9BURK|nr:Putative non-heme bromoperoxidase BpoC [Pandoraea terrae]